MRTFGLRCIGLGICTVLLITACGSPVQLSEQATESTSLTAQAQASTPPAPSAVPTTFPTGTPALEPTHTPVTSDTSSSTNTPEPQSEEDTVLVGVGDIASCDSDGDERTAALLDTIAGTVFTVGDNVYDSGSAAEFANCFQPSWGRHKARIRPAAGNHEYRQEGAADYFAYFGTMAGEPGKGYYSYDIGAWHIVVLNSNCEHIGCEEGSTQEQWLRADLAAHSNTCTLAYWHHPRWSSGLHGSEPSVDAFWRALYDNAADVVLTGHDHHYERFQPQTPDAKPDPERGIRAFVVGMGGNKHYPMDSLAANSEVRNNDAYGLLKLTLHPTSYDWEFVAVEGDSFDDAGSASCVTSSAAVTSTTPGGSSLTFIPDADARVEEQQEKATFGTEGSLRVDGEDQAHGESYLRFTLRGVSEEVEKAVLRVYAMSSTDDGPMLYTTKNEWAESTIAWANRPPRDSTMIGEGGKIQSTSWVEYDVTTIVKGEGVYSFVLTSNSDDGISFVSREGDYPPELVVTLAN